MPVYFFSTDIKSPSLPKRKLQSFLAALFKREGLDLDELSYVFCSDEYLLDINRRFLNHDYYTDIITFDISDNIGEVKGEIYISVDRVKDNANQLQQTIQQELLRVVFHGALHLCGYKDKTKAQKIEMRRKEDHCLNQFHK